MALACAFVRSAFTVRASRAPRDANESNKGPKKMLYEVKQTNPPQRSLGCHKFPKNTHCGDTIELRNKYFVVDKVSYHYKLEFGKYRQNDTRLYVQEATRYLLNKHLDALFVSDDAVKSGGSDENDREKTDEAEVDTA